MPCSARAKDSNIESYKEGAPLDRHNTKVGSAFARPSTGIVNIYSAFHSHHQVSLGGYKAASVIELHSQFFLNLFLPTLRDT